MALLAVRVRRPGEGHFRGAGGRSSAVRDVLDGFWPVLLHLYPQPDRGPVLTIISTIIPVVQFSGLLNPVSSLVGVGAFIGRIYPATYFLNITRGVFNKALGFSSLHGFLRPLFVALPVVVGLAIALLKKQET